MTTKKKKEWERLFDQLGFSSGTMSDSLLAILFLAKSQTELERLNNQLPPPCQVLNKDLPALKKVRKALLDGGGPELEDFKGLLTSLTIEVRSMEVYYVEELEGERELCPLAERRNHKKLDNAKDGRDRPICDLRSTLFGESVEIELCISNDGTTLGVRVIKWSLGLTRDFVQKALNHDVLSTLPHGGIGTDSREKGEELDWWVLLDAEPFMMFVEKGREAWMIQDGFTEKLESALHELGLEIGPIVPDLTVAKKG